MVCLIGYARVSGKAQDADREVIAGGKHVADILEDLPDGFPILVVWLPAGLAVSHIRIGDPGSQLIRCCLAIVRTARVRWQPGLSGIPPAAVSPLHPDAR